MIINSGQYQDHGPLDILRPANPSHNISDVILHVIYDTLVINDSISINISY